MKFHFFIFFSIIFLFSNCKTETKETTSLTYQKKADELTSQIISENEDCSCLIEIENKESLLELLSAGDPSIDYKKNVKDALNFENDSLFNKMNEYTTNFKFDNTNIKNLYLITNEELQLILKKYLGLEKLNYLATKCPKGWMSVSAPIFNVDFSLAIINIHIHPEGQLILFENNNGKWKRVKVLRQYIS